VRDFLLQQMLAPRLGPQAVLVVLVLRVLWTIAELSIAGVMYLVPVPKAPPPDSVGSQPAPQPRSGEDSGLGHRAPVLETPVSPPPADSSREELASPSLLSR
jgi:hypothetical protein